LKTALDTFVENYNDGYLHSALGHEKPNKFEQEHLGNRQATPNPAASLTGLPYSLFCRAYTLNL